MYLKKKGHAGYYEGYGARGYQDPKLTVTERTGMASYNPADQQYGTIIIGGGISATPIDKQQLLLLPRISVGKVMQKGEISVGAPLLRIKSIL